MRALLTKQNTFIECEYEKDIFEIDTSNGKITKTKEGTYNMTNVNMTYWDNTFLCGPWINSNQNAKITWTVEFNVAQNTQKFIGIVAWDPNLDLSRRITSCSKKSIAYYCVSSPYPVIVNGQKKHKVDTCYKGIIKVSLTLDLSKRKLLYFIVGNKQQDNKQGCLFAVETGANIKYKFAFSLCHKDDWIKLLSLKGLPKEEMDQKQNDEIQQLKQQNDELIKNASNLQNQNDELNNKIIEYVKQVSFYENETSSLKQQLKINQQSLQQQNQIKNTNAKFKRENESLQNEKKEMSKMIELLQHEKKEMEMEMLSLKKENTKLRLSNIDPNDYGNWSSEQVIYWIVSLENGKYAKYSAVLKQSFDEEDVDGSCLDDVDTADIKVWGIKNFKDRKAILTHIQQLKSKNNNMNINNNMHQMNEGTNPPTAYI